MREVDGYKFIKQVELQDEGLIFEYGQLLDTIQGKKKIGAPKRLYDALRRKLTRATGIKPPMSFDKVDGALVIYQLEDWVNPDDRIVIDSGNRGHGEQSLDGLPLDEEVEMFRD